MARAYWSVTVKKYFEHCTLEEATQLLDHFSGGDWAHLSVSVQPETNKYDEWLGSYKVVVDGLGVGGIHSIDNILHFAKEQFESIENW